MADQSKKTYNLLVAEDDIFQRMTLMSLLKMCNFEVTACDHGQQVLDKIESGGIYDALLIDLYMPVMDGFTCLEKLYEMRETEKYSWLQFMPIAVMSSQTTQDIIDKVMGFGAKKFMVKPLPVP